MPEKKIKKLIGQMTKQLLKQEDKEKIKQSKTESRLGRKTKWQGGAGTYNVRREQRVQEHLRSQAGTLYTVQEHFMLT
jgi:hypothetical protein